MVLTGEAVPLHPCEHNINLSALILRVIVAHFLASKISNLCSILDSELFTKTIRAVYNCPVFRCLKACKQSKKGIFLN
jgi:hypothetical protein